jgi:hypothetical protein
MAKVESGRAQPAMRRRAISSTSSRPWQACITSVNAASSASSIVCPFEVEEHDGRQPCQPLVAVDQRMVPGEGVQQRGRLERERRIGILTEGTRARARDSGVEEAEVSHGAGAEGSHERQQVVEFEVLDRRHTLPSRCSTSPQRSSIRSVLPRTRASCPARS